MVAVHFTVGVLLFALNLAAGGWGVIAWLTRRPSPAFWYVLRAAQVAVILQTVLGGLLLVTGHKAGSPIHYLYGVIPLVVTLVTESLRVGAAQSVVGDTDYRVLPEEDQRRLALRIFVAETRVMALGCLFIAADAIRAAMTSGGL